HRRRNHGPSALGDDALIVLDRGLGRRDVGAGECRCGERRIGDPGLCCGIAFLGRKFVAMEGARSGLLRLPLAAAEQAPALPAEQAATLIVIVGITGPALSILWALHPREQAGAGGRVAAEGKTPGQTSGNEDA